MLKCVILCVKQYFTDAYYRTFENLTKHVFLDLSIQNNSLGDINDSKTNGELAALSADNGFGAGSV
ncbi:hypothetical protein SAMN06295916_0006 [Polynucleobacter victoriensis]|uniref:Uncharacterized protein n=1 Tax=Polynucleobacter victoriensis TaxID=2049319 RepID=A0A212T077_9BURK|nr:hypothetical protein SAMN06295916_0006 [Polynucleobacter victoriensis]